MDGLGEIQEFEQFHPRAVKLLRKKKNFIVIAEDEPYFFGVYNTIREYEKTKGTWTQKDEIEFMKAVRKQVKDFVSAEYDKLP